MLLFASAKAAVNSKKDTRGEYCSFNFNDGIWWIYACSVVDGRAEEHDGHTTWTQAALVESGDIAGVEFCFTCAGIDGSRGLIDWMGG